MISGNKQIFYSGKTRNPTQQKKIKYRTTKRKNRDESRNSTWYNREQNQTDPLNRHMQQLREVDTGG